MTAYTQDLIDSLTALNEIAATLNRSVNVQSALDSALAHLIELMGLETGWVFLKDPAAKNQWAGRGYVLAAHHNLPPAMGLDKASAWKGGCDCQGFCNKGTLTEGYNEVRCSRLAEAKMEDRGGLSVHASAPLRSGEVTLGILNVAAAEWKSFTPEALALLTNVGSQIGIALERSRLFDMLHERRITEQASLLDLSNQLLARSNLNEIVSYLVAEARRLLGVDACALVMPGGEPGTLIFTASSGWRNDPVALAQQMTDNEFNVVSQAMRAQAPFLAEDIEEHVIPLYELEWLQPEGFRGYAILPLLVEGHPIGALMLNTRRPRLLEEDEIRFLQLMTNQAAIAIEEARLRQEELERQRMEDELALGRQIQLSMLPTSCPVIEGWEFVAVYQAARMVGGDFYDFFQVPRKGGRLGMVIGDVADKGVPAALFMTLSRTLIRSTALGGRKPASALTRANTLILNDSQTDLFLSAFYGLLNTRTGRMVFANAGHNRPLWYHAETGQVRELRAQGIVLGAFQDITLEECQIVIGPGDVVLFYTDGVTEALSPGRELFGTERLEAVVRASAQGSAQDVKRAIVDAYNAFTGDMEQSDDVTFFVVKREA
jgi:sigma-B regulation protein RsbU (phosphoserine phosphatase)